MRNQIINKQIQEELEKQPELLKQEDQKKVKEDLEQVKLQILQNQENKFNADEKESVVLSFLNLDKRFTKDYVIYKNEEKNVQVVITLRTINDEELKALNWKLQELSMLGSKTKTKYFSNMPNAQEVEVISHIDNQRAMERAYLAAYVSNIGGVDIPEKDDKNNPISLNDRIKKIERFYPSFLDHIYEKPLYDFLSLINASLNNLSVF